MLDSMLQKYNIQTSDQLFQAYREIVQEIVLAGLWKGNFFQKGAFYGGTALRILYGLDRFRGFGFLTARARSSFFIT